MNYIEGTPRDQLTFLSTTFDDLIAEDNPVRFIDAYVDQLDLAKLGFIEEDNTTGRPPYHPGMLMKIYTYAYLNKIRSSRKIEKELMRNNELVWLAEALQPDFRTLAGFRKNNAKPLTLLFKEFLLFCRKLDLISFETVGIDGTKIRGQNNINNVFRRDTIDAVSRKIDEKIDEYMKELDKNDAHEDSGIVLKKEKIAARVKALKQARAKADDAKKKFDETPEKDVVFSTDEDVRMMNDKGKIRPGYNVQTAVDAKNKLITVAAVTQDGNDMHQMTPMLDAVSEMKKELGVSDIKTTAEMDAGYHVEEEVMMHKDSAEFDIVAPSPKDSPKAQDPDSVPKKEFRADNFRYSKTTDTYVCPEGKTLSRITPEGGVMVDGKHQSRYQCRSCASCDKRSLCTRGIAGRIISHSEHHEAMEAFRQKMKTPEYAAKIKQRKELCEHPFGTLKRGFGFDHFLLKGLEKVKGEFSLMCFAYNLRRSLSIVGIRGLIAALGR